jgi:hypothetical protein
MKTYRLGLMFSSDRGDVAGHGPSFAHVYIKHPLRNEYGGRLGKPTILTLREYGTVGFNQQADQLIAELKELKVQAKRRFNMAKRRVRQP